MDSTGTLGFLSGLRHISAAAAGVRDDIYFMVDVAAGADARVCTVDSSGAPVDTAPGDCEGAVGAMLRDMARCAASVAAGWGRRDGEQPRGVSLADNPLLMYRLVECPRVVGPDMQPVAVSRERARVTMSFSRQADTVTPRLLLSRPGAMPAGFDFLTDSFALCEGTIYPVESLGDAYRRASTFEHPFAATALAGYLSVLLSYLPGICVESDFFTLECDPAPLSPRPVLEIERVGQDRSMYLRLRRRMPDGLPAEALHLGVTRMVVETSPGRFTARPLAAADSAAASRDLLACIASMAPSRAAAREVYSDGHGFFIVPGAVASVMMLKGLPELLGRYDIIGTDRLLRYGVRTVVPQLRLTSLSSGIDYLEAAVEVDLDGTVMPLAALFAARETHGAVELPDGTRLVPDPATMKRLERIFGESAADAGRERISFFDMPEVEQMLAPGESASQAFSRPREFYDGFNRLSRTHLTLPDIRATLRPYQRWGVKWLRYLYRYGLGGCLADDMGLGKTLQAIALLSTIYPAEKRPTLIVMPRSLLFNWQAELERFCPTLTRSMYYGAGRDLDRALGSQLVLTTYAIVRNDIERLAAVKFHMVILDESQNIKNLHAGVTRSVMRLDAPHRLALSGTPIENNLMELYSLFRFLDPGMFGSAADFASRYAAPVQREADRDTLAALRRRIYPFMLRRLKGEVLRELPDRIDQTITVDMDPAQARLYEQRRRAFAERVSDTIAGEGLARGRFVMLQALSELRRIASVPESLTDGAVTSPKLELLSERLVEAARNGHKSVAFFNFIAGIELTCERLDSEGIDYAVMTGSTTDRRSVVERFQTDPSCRVLLMTLKTGGVGLNLTAADTVFIVEPWWNRAAEEQAIDRLHRFGQRAKVMCCSLITRGTIEEKIRELQQRKAELTADVITGDSTAAKQLTEEDINFMLS